MTRIKLCGLTRKEDILTANELMPDHIGFVLWEKSRRYVRFEKAKELKELLDPRISAVGVFVDEDIERVAEYLNEGIIDAAQLHGSEDDDYIRRLQHETGRPVIKAFRISAPEDSRAFFSCPAELLLLDSGAGGGTLLDRKLLAGIERPYFLAGGLSADNVEEAMAELHPYGVDVSSGIETDGAKDHDKMRRFVECVRRFERSE